MAVRRYAEANETLRARGAPGPPSIGVDHSARRYRRRVPSYGYLEPRREGDRLGVRDTAGAFSASFFKRRRDAKLRSYLAARKGAGR
jgi:hypothetical protein